MRKLLLVCFLFPLILPVGMYAQTGTGGGLFSDNAGGFTSVAFAGLGAPGNSKVRYCTNCNPNTFPCTGGGSGAFAYRVGGAWICPSIIAGAAGTVTSVGNGTIGSLFTASWATATTTPALSLDITNQGTATTVLHGNVAGHPLFGAVVSADLNITSTTCTNQFLSAISSAAVGTCTGFTLASAQFANQGTTTTLLHGNGVGNPSFGSVALGDMATQATNTVIGNATSGTAVPTALAVGTCSGAANALNWTTNTGFGCNGSITANTVTTNANLTGPINSTGNATAIASQTGTGTKFVVDTNPALVGPTTDTLQTSGNVGIGAAQSATQGLMLLSTGNGAFLTKNQISNSSALDGAGAFFQASSDGSGSAFFGQRSTGNTGTALGVTIGGYSDIVLIPAAGKGGLLRTIGALSIIAGTNGLRSLTMSGSNQAVSFVGTNTNDSATAGDVGELTSGTTAANTTSLSTGTTANVGAGSNITLTAGDWDCTGVVNFTFGATTSITNLAGGISTTSATLPAQDSFFDYETSAIVPTGSAVATWVVPTVRVSVASSTSVFLVSQATFSVSTIKVGGTIRCRRMR